MDNFRIDVTCRHKENLLLAMKLAFSQHSFAEGYRIDESKKLLIFYWYIPNDKTPHVNKLPFKMKYDMATDFALSWLAEQDYGRQPDHDGDNEKGWRVYNEAWGHVENDSCAFLAITPTWAMYGK